ncbi:unnamed protein product [Nyctereutes procyonoides]|uniref:(raccoon dog) hypothetical protein n=1 Tax=Nyctereutes procyonoides TaxID=34880 RepID=A0A811Z347_NYCPR|nr:unnamed protein product [Nyctereutes procyonoides]
MRYPLRHGATCWSLGASAARAPQPGPPPPSASRRGRPSPPAPAPADLRAATARPPACPGQTTPALSGPGPFLPRAPPPTGSPRRPAAPRPDPDLDPDSDPGPAAARRNQRAEAPGRGAGHLRRTSQRPISSGGRWRVAALPRPGRGAVCVRACACFICAGFGKTGWGLHFAPHTPGAEFRRPPGPGGLRGATRPAPQRPPRARPGAASRPQPARRALGVGGSREGGRARGSAGSMRVRLRAAAGPPRAAAGSPLGRRVRASRGGGGLGARESPSARPPGPWKWTLQVNAAWLLGNRCRRPAGPRAPLSPRLRRPRPRQLRPRRRARPRGRPAGRASPNDPPQLC